MSSKRKAEATRWFRQAEYDLKAARWNIQGGFYDAACFLAQQTGEKALKSLLYYLGARRTALFTHSLVEMIQAVGRKVPVVEEVAHSRLPSCPPKPPIHSPADSPPDSGHRRCSGPLRHTSR